MFCELGCFGLLREGLLTELFHAIFQARVGAGDEFFGGCVHHFEYGERGAEADGRGCIVARENALELIERRVEECADTVSHFGVVAAASGLEAAHEVDVACSPAVDSGAVDAQTLGGFGESQALQDESKGLELLRREIFGRICCIVLHFVA